MVLVDGGKVAAHQSLLGPGQVGGREGSGACGSEWPVHRCSLCLQYIQVREYSRGDACARVLEEGCVGSCGLSGFAKGISFFSGVWVGISARVL